jgi:hypothetical protein
VLHTSLPDRLEISLDLTRQPAGMYFVTVQTGTGVETLRLVLG